MVSKKFKDEFFDDISQANEKKDTTIEEIVEEDLSLMSLSDIISEKINFKTIQQNKASQKTSWSVETNLTFGKQLRFEFMDYCL